MSKKNKNAMVETRATYCQMTNGGGERTRTTSDGREMKMQTLSAAAAADTKKASQTIYVYAFRCWRYWGKVCPSLADLLLEVLDARGVLHVFALVLVEFLLRPGHLRLQCLVFRCKTKQ